MAAQGSKTKTTRSKTTTFDFTAVEAVDGNDNLKTLRKSKVDDTPFPSLYVESWNSGLAKVMTIPETAAKEAAQLASAAGRRFGIQYNVKSGVRTRVTPAEQAGFVVFEFIAVDRTKDTGDVDAEVADEDIDGTDEAPASE